MIITITPSEQAFGTQLTRLDLTQPLDSQAVATIKSASLVHHVHSFPQQAMNDDDLDCFGPYMGPFGTAPFISTSTVRSHVIVIKRSADETSSLFAEGWHTDWNFQENPPISSCLFGITIPPHYGDMLHINQHKTLAEISAELQAKIEGKFAIYSAVTAYAPQDLLSKLYQWQTRPKPQYCQQWQKGTLVMCNNSSVLHRASIGGTG